MTELYQKAFEIKKSGLWDIFLEEQIFALKIKNGDMIYVQIRRNDDEEKTVSVYYGEGSLEMVRRIMDTDPDTMADEEEAEHLFAMIEGAELCFTNKASLTGKEQEVALAAAKLSGIRPGGSGAYPRFRRLKKGQPFAPLSEKRDIQIMMMALDAAMWFIKGKSGKVRLFIPATVRSSFEMAVLEADNEGYTQNFIKMPKLGRMVYPAGVNSNEILQKRIKKMVKRGRWACRIVRLDVVYEWGENNEKVLPSVMKIINLDNGDFIEMMPVAHYEERTEVVLDKFMEAICDYGSAPVQIFVMEERTAALLGRWCKNCGIRLSRVEYIPELDMYDGIYDGGDDEDDRSQGPLFYIEMAVDFLISVPDGRLKGFAEDIQGIRGVKNSLFYTMLSDEYRKKIDDLIIRFKKLGL